MSSYGYLVLFCALWIAYSCFLVLKNIRWAGQFQTDDSNSQPVDPGTMTGWRAG